MDEYIKKETVLNALCTVSAPTPTESWIVEKCIEKVNEVFADDVAPVVHGRWIFKNDNCGCSVCMKCLSYDGNGVILDLSHLPYCPHCGARMDG